MGHVMLYVVYGTLAAGIFEETARFLTYGTEICYDAMMKKVG